MSGLLSLAKKLSWYIRHALFYIVIIPTTVLIATGGLLLAWLGPKTTYWFVTRWSWVYVHWASICFNLKFHIKGLDNIPKSPCVVIANHQSNWETLFMQLLLPRQSWVLKRELLWIPFFGWGLALLQPISIRRQDRHSIKRLLVEGKKRLDAGRWVIIYPEGTRLGVESFKNFSRSAAALAIHANVPILPIAHNAGYFWPRGPWIQNSGVIQVSIGQPIEVNPQQSATSDLTKEVERWINAERQKMPPLSNLH